MMDDHRAGLNRQMREIAAATGEAADACLPGLLRRLHHHESRLPGNRLLAPYRRWRIRHLAMAVYEARRHVEEGRLARLGGLATRR